MDRWDVSWIITKVSIIQYDLRNGCDISTYAHLRALNINIDGEIVDFSFKANIKI